MQPCREEGLRYGEFIHGLNKANIELNRKMLSELAIHEPEAFKELVGKAKTALCGLRARWFIEFWRGERSPSHCGSSGGKPGRHFQPDPIGIRQRVSILGPKGTLTQASKLIGHHKGKKKPAFGQALNKAKKVVEALFAASLSKIEEQADLAALECAYDPTLPIPNRSGSLHPLSATRRKVVSIFRKIGFTVTEATEVETEWFCFDALNTPEDHPARDAQDTLFFSPESKWANVSKKLKEAHLLRTHTSSVQIRTMLREKPPLRVIAPGRCFSQRHSRCYPPRKFSPDRGSVYRPQGYPARDLKGVLIISSETFGNKVQTRCAQVSFPSPSQALKWT